MKGNESKFDTPVDNMNENHNLCTETCLKMFLGI